MSEDPTDPNDEFEDQLSDVGSRTREKLSAEEQKKAEKLGVSPSTSTEPSSEAAGNDATKAENESTDDSDTDSTANNGDPAEQTPPSAAESSETGSDSGTVYEYNDMNSELEHEPETANDDQQTTTESTAEPVTTEPADGPTAGLGTIAAGERMAVTKTEIDFVTGEETETKETEKTKLLYFELNDELFAAPLESISSVEELSGLTRYPRSPEPIDGVTDMRGKIIAVLNPKVIVDLSNASHEDGTGGDYIIVQEEIEDEHRLGVRVDDISHVESAAESDITPIYDISEMDLVTIDQSYLEGIIHGYRADEQAQVPLVDFSALMETLKEY